MSEEDPSNTANALATLGAGAAAHEAYVDLLKPAFRELGGTALLVAKTLNLAFTPLQGMVWGGEKARDWVIRALAKRLETVPPEAVQVPPASIAGQIVMQLGFCAQEEELRELYANLLAAAMDKTASSKVHPAFVQLIQQLAPSEALLLRQMIRDATPEVLGPHRNAIVRFFAGHEISEPSFHRICARCGVPDLEKIRSATDNFIRLRIVAHRVHSRFVVTTGAPHEHNGISLTSLGREFLQVCVREPGHPYPLDVAKNTSAG